MGNSVRKPLDVKKVVLRTLLYFTVVWICVFILYVISAKRSPQFFVVGT